MSISLTAIRKSVAIVTIASMVAFSIPAGFASALTAGPNTAGAGTNVTGVGTIAWTNASGVSNSGVASAVITANAQTNYLQATNFGFSVPANSVIDGIQVSIVRRASNGGSLDDNIVRLMKASVIIGDDKADTTDWSAATTTATYGSTSDLWGATWTASDVNNANFGVAFSVDSDSGSTRTAYVDSIQVTVTYRTAYTVTSSVGANGAISPNGATVVASGDDQSYIITPSAGYIVDDVLVDAASQGRLNEYTFDNVTAAHTVSASFSNGWTAPTDTDNNSGVSGDTNAFVSDESDAVFNNSSDQTEYDEFGLNIPGTATINGIEVALEGERDSGRTLDVSLSSNNGGSYTSAQNVAFSSTESTVIVGGPSDLWGRSWTAAQLNDTFDFQVLVDATSGGGNINLDQIQVKVYYTTNTAPVATNVIDSTNEDVAKLITLTATDGESNPLTYATTSNPTNGTLGLISGNQVMYTPNPNYFGSDSFSFKANDGSLDSNTATVNITISSLNDAPVANDDAYSTDEDVATTTGNVLTNDTDVENNPLSVDAFDSASTQGGTVSSNGNGTFEYTPPTNYSGNDTFTYTVSDGNGGTDTATVTINVSSLNDSPVANADDYVTPEDTALNVTLVTDGVLDNDTDVDNNPLTAQLVDDFTGGVLVLNSDGTFTFTPALNFNGSVTFTYKANDGSADSGVAIVTIDVGDVNDDPVLDSISNPTVVYGETPVIFIASASDVDSAPMTYSLSGEPAGATINSSTGEFSWDTTGISPSVHPFDVIVEDGEGGSDSQGVIITIEKADTSISITNAADLMSGPSESTGSYEVKWSVSVEDPGAGIPTGMVVITGLSGATCSAAVEIGKCDLNSPVGTEEITAEYLGDTNFDGSMSSTVEHDLIDSTPGSGGPGGGGGNGPILSGPGAVLGASIGPSGVGAPQGQVLGEATSTVSTSTPETTDTTPPACSALITKVPMSQGRPSNDPAQVSALQTFLNKELGTSLAVNGTFDAATTLAVNAFQLKYSTDILAPWGLTEPTGVVYLLSQWKINMIECPSLNLPRPSVN